MLKGYRILGRRVRTRAGEIDLIARAPSGLLCFIEVKARPDEPGGRGNRSMPRQQARIARAAALYLAGRPGLARQGVRFDIVTVAPRRLAAPSARRMAPRPLRAIGEGTPAEADLRPCERDATDPADYLRRLGEAARVPTISRAAALMLAALDHPAVRSRPMKPIWTRSPRPAATRLRLIYRAEDAAKLLAGLLAGRFGYDGDRLSYDDPQNADLMAVIDRRRGLPVALGILYLHAARAGGLEAAA